jgi:hypothetical protein
MQRLNLPDHGVKTKPVPGGAEVFDPVRRKWVALTPEEWVRQHFLQFMVQDLGCPASLIAVEKAITLHGLSKRADLVVHGTDGAPLALVECKAPQVKLDQAVFEQAARYNIVFRVAWLFVTNGLQHYCCRIEHSTGAVHFLSEMPGFAAMTGSDQA